MASGLLRLLCPTRVPTAIAAAVCGLAAGRLWAAANAPPVLPGIGEAMQQLADQNAMAGVVTLVVSHDQVVHLQATGVSNLATQRPMASDDLFAIASMTKPITAAAVLLLQDEGRLNVNDEVARYIPAFAALRTPSGQLARLTIAHLLTHTSGLSAGTNVVGNGTLASLVPFYLAEPTAFEPGTAWEYSNSAFNVLGRIVEVASGVSFDGFLRQRFFEPLGMRDTTFYPTPAQRLRLATLYINHEGTLLPVTTTIPEPNGALGDHYWAPYASGGLFSTAADYARFCRMVLNGGELDGQRYLSSAAVQAMTSIHTGDLHVGTGIGYGYGWRIVREPQGAIGMLSVGTFGHSGSYGTQAWIDPAKDVIYILMVQRTGFSGSAGSALTQTFQQIAADALAPPPVITLQPLDCTIAEAEPLALTVTASSELAVTYQWRKDGADLPGATEPVLLLRCAAAADSGDYAVAVRNRSGETTSRRAAVRVVTAPTARLGNVSVRANVTNERPLQVGFVTLGAKRLLVRGAGPALAPFGLAGCFPDPCLELCRQDGRVLASNEDWPADLGDTFASVGAFPFARGSRDAAIVQMVNGPHAVRLKGSGAGIALVEIYAADTDGSSCLLNFSARQSVGAGNDVLIAGFNVNGDVAKTLLFRGVGGPKLASFGVPGTLADPRLELFDGAGALVAANDNWNAALAPFMRTSGAFDLEAGSADAAILITVPPGSYSAHLSGAGGATGEALLEVYAVSR